MALDIDRIPFGLANITIGEADTALKFDGVNEFQAEGGELVITPLTEPINVEDFGTGDYDEIVVGFEATLTINAAQESIEVMKVALAAVEEITDSTSGEVSGLMDAAIGTSLRKKGKRVHIHPRKLPKEFKDLDITIFKMISNGEYTRTTGNTQGSITINMKMLPRDGMDPSKPGNYYYTGANDPNAVVTP